MMSRYFTRKPLHSTFTRRYRLGQRIVLGLRHPRCCHRRCELGVFFQVHASGVFWESVFAVRWTRVWSPFSGSRLRALQ